MRIVNQAKPSNLLIGAVGLAAALGAAAGASAQDYTSWRSYAGGTHSSQYSALDQINRSNVDRLDVVWQLPVERNMLFIPIVVDGVKYVLR